MRTFKNLWSLLSKAQRRSAVVLLGLMLIGMLLEIISIGMVIPALALMTQDDLPGKYPILNILGDSGHEQLVMSGMLILVGVYFVKTVFLAFLAWKQSCFVADAQEDISLRLFTGYLNQPYVFHLQRNSAQLIRNSIGQVSDVTDVFKQTLMLITEFLVLFGVAVLLFVVEPLGALIVMCTFFFMSWCFNYFTRERILDWGELRQRHEGMRIQHLQQGLGGIKDVKLYGRADEFTDQYARHNTGSARSVQHLTFLLALPRLWLEFLAVAGLSVLILVMLGGGKSIESLIPTVGVFAAAAFRFMPSVGRILNAVQSVRFTLPAINTLCDEFRILREVQFNQRGPLIPLTSSIAINHVSYRYPASEMDALCDINILVRFGETVGFIGGSGAGKSTLVDVILGLLTPTTGKVLIDGVQIQESLRCWQDQIGYVPQSIYLTDDSLKSNIAFGLTLDQINDDLIDRAVQAAQLEQFIKDLPQGLDTMVGERGVRLSGGQRQRIGIARALYLDPPVLVLDEATSSLDTSTESDVMESVRALKGKKTIIIVAHRLSTVECCDRLFRLEKGKIVAEGESMLVLSNIMVESS